LQSGTREGKGREWKKNKIERARRSKMIVEGQDEMMV
jgi:hypothetical protein